MIPSDAAEPDATAPPPAPPPLPAYPPIPQAPAPGVQVPQVPGVQVPPIPGVQPYDPNIFIPGFEPGKLFPSLPGTGGTPYTPNW